MLQNKIRSYSTAYGLLFKIQLLATFKEGFLMIHFFFNYMPSFQVYFMNGQGFFLLISYLREKLSVGGLLSLGLIRAPNKTQRLERGGGRIRDSRSSLVT